MQQQSALNHGTRRLPLAVVALLLAFAAAACGAGEAIEETAGSVAAQMQAGVEAVPVAAALSCDTERRILEVAIEAFTLLQGAPPAAESDLVGDYLREQSALFDLDPSGAIVPAPGSICT